MAQQIEPQKAGKIQIPLVDGLLWIIRIGAITAILWGGIASLSSGRLTGEAWRDLVVFGLSQGSVYALIALGYTMVYGVLRFINFAHGEVFTSGALVGAFASSSLARTALWQQRPLLSLFLVLIVCMTTSMVVAIILERVAYRSLRGAPRLIPLITSIGASFFLQYTYAGLFGTGIKAYPPTEVIRGSFKVGSVTILRSQAVVIVAALLIMTALYFFVEKTKAGRAIRAVAEDAEIARLMGINVDRTIVLVFAVGGAMAGAAGLLYGLMFSQVHFFSGFLPGIKAFTSAVLGGIGNLAGAMVGGLVLGMVESLGPSLVLAGLNIPSPHQLKDVVAFLTLVLILIFRPSGILGERLSEERT